MNSKTYRKQNVLSSLIQEQTSYPIPGNVCRENKNIKERTVIHPIFIITQFIITKTQNKHRYPPTDEWIRKYGTYTQWTATVL